MMTYLCTVCSWIQLLTADITHTDQVALLLLLFAKSWEALRLTELEAEKERIWTSLLSSRLKKEAALRTDVGGAAIITLLCTLCIFFQLSTSVLI